MVTIEQKLAEFQKIIDDKVERENSQLLETKTAEIEEYLSKLQQETTDQFRKNQKLALDRIDRQKQEQLSALIQSEKREQLKLMEDFLSQLTKKIQDKCKAFVLSQEYPGFVRELIVKTLEKEGVDKSEKLEISLAPQNFENAKAEMIKGLQEAMYQTYEITEGDIDAVGGFVVDIPNQGLRVNKTLRDSIEEKQDEVGQYIQSYIQGGVN